jgi:hypothetical protein
MITQEALLEIIATTLIVLTIELSIVFVIAIIFLYNAMMIIRRVKAYESTIEKKMDKLEKETAIVAMAVIIFLKGFNKYLKK